MNILEGKNLYVDGELSGPLNLTEGERAGPFVIVESCGPLTVVEPSLDEAKDDATVVDGKKTGHLMALEGRFQMADTPNANNRIYPGKIWDNVFEDKELLKSVDRGEMLGEADHPKDGETRLGRVAGKVSKVWRNPENLKEVMGRFTVFDNEAGRNLKAIQEGGGRLGISSRGTGSVVHLGGKDVVQEDYSLKTWDVVHGPSTHGAYPNEVMESKAKDMGADNSEQGFVLEPVEGGGDYNFRYHTDGEMNEDAMGDLDKILREQGLVVKKMSARGKGWDLKLAITEMKAGAPVKAWFTLLSSAITQEDQRREKSDLKRGISPNIYAGAIMLGAAQDVERAMSGMLDRSDKASLQTLKAKVTAAFNPFRSLTAWQKKLDAAIASAPLTESIDEAKAKMSKGEFKKAEQAINDVVASLGNDSKAISSVLAAWKKAKKDIVVESEHIMEPGFVKTPADEKLWARAKAKAQEQDADDLYALANHIFQNMKKNETVEEADVNDGFYIVNKADGRVVSKGHAKASSADTELSKSKDWSTDTHQVIDAKYLNKSAFNESDSLSESGSCEACGAPMVVKGDDGNTGVCKDCKECQKNEKDMSGVKAALAVKADTAWKKAKKDLPDSDKSKYTSGFMKGIRDAEADKYDLKKRKPSGTAEERGYADAGWGRLPMHEADKKCKKCGEDCKMPLCAKCCPGMNKNETIAARPTTTEGVTEAVKKLNITPVFSEVNEALRVVRIAYREAAPIEGPLSSQEKKGLNEAAKELIERSEKFAEDCPVIRFWVGNCAKEDASEVFEARSELDLRNKINEIASDTDGSGVVNVDRSEDVYTECANRFSGLLEAQTLKAERAIRDLAENSATTTELSAKVAGAKKLIEALVLRCKKLETERTSNLAEAKAAHTILDEMAAEFESERLRGAVIGIAATNADVDGLSEALCKSENITEAVQTANRISTKKAPLINLEPTHEEHLEEALLANKGVETRKTSRKDRRKDSLTDLTKRVTEAMLRKSTL